MCLTLSVYSDSTLLPVMFITHKIIDYCSVLLSQKTVNFHCNCNIEEDFHFSVQCICVCVCVCENSDPVQSHAVSADVDDLLLMYHVCPLCDQQFDTTDLLQLHVDTHFDERHQATSSEYF